MAVEYMLMTGNDLAREQVHCLETILDPWSIEVLSGTGIGLGQHCLDVGSGGSSITRWLAGRVGPAGRVVSIGQEPKWRIDQELMLDPRFRVWLYSFHLSRGQRPGTGETAG